MAKELLAMANSGGGIIVFGVKESETNKFDPCGLQEESDPADIHNSIEKYISSNLKYKIESFNFDRSEYEKLQGKQFQVIIVDDLPQYLPYISEGETEGLKKATIYVRHGTECVVADKEDIENLINRRISTGHKSKLEFEDHIQQLKTLYRHKLPDKSSLLSTLTRLSIMTSSYNTLNNTEFYSYIDELIEKKKKIIEMDLGIY